MENIKVNLKILRDLVAENTCVNPTIKNVYIDVGSNWMADTLVAPGVTDGFSYQMLSPRDIQKLNKNLYTIKDAQELIDKINQRGW